MIRAPHPEDEALRLALLSRTGLLDDRRDPFLDALTITTARSFGVSMGAITLIDARWQFFKAHTGLAMRSTPRECSFCAHLLWWPEPMVILDALGDERFADNPLVVDEPRIRFYAGVPLHLRGICIGSLCVMDTRPWMVFEDRHLRLLRGASMAVEERLIQMTSVRTLAERLG